MYIFYTVSLQLDDRVAFVSFHSWSLPQIIAVKLFFQPVAALLFKLTTRFGIKSWHIPYIYIYIYIHIYKLKLTPWLMEPISSMPHSQGLPNNYYPEPNHPNSQHSNIVLPSTPRPPLKISFLEVYLLTF